MRLGWSPRKKAECTRPLKIQAGDRYASRPLLLHILFIKVSIEAKLRFRGGKQTLLLAKRSYKVIS